MPTALTKGGLKAVGAGLKTVVGAVGGAIETNRQHVSSKDMHKVTGSFDVSNPKYYKPVMSAFGEIFIHYNLQFVHLLDEKKIDFHWSKAMHKLAVDSVIKVFHGFKEIQENNEELPIEFSKIFVIECFLKGNSEGGVIDKLRSKLSGKSLGGKLTHKDSENDFFTQDLFEMPLVKAKNNKLYGSHTKSLDDQRKFLYRHLFDHEDLKLPLPCCIVPHKKLTFYFYFKLSIKLNWTKNIIYKFKKKLSTAAVVN